jgi:tRNA(fMet)-specific endonuclease VapC
VDTEGGIRLIYFLDTNICIFLINAKYPRLNQLYSTYEKNTIKVSSMVLFELRYGAEKSQKRQKTIENLNNFLSGIQIIPFDEQTAKIAGIIRADLERNGQIIGGNDLLIAATVLANNGIMVTNNVREFSHVKNLIIEDWSNR